MDEMLEKIFVMEIEKQCKFGLLCKKNMDEFLVNPISKDITEFWFYAQGFLISAANISKLLWGSDKPEDNRKRYKERSPLREKLGINSDSALNDRRVRNCYEHFDEKIEHWIGKTKNRAFVDSNIGTENMIGNMKKKDHIRFYDLEKHILSFQAKEFHIEPVVEQMIKLRESASLYLK